MKAKMSKFTVSKIQPIRLKDLGHVTRIDQSKTSILRFRDFLRHKGAQRSKRKIFVLWLGSFCHVAQIKKNFLMDLFLIKNHFSVLFLTHSFPLISSSPFFFLTLHVPFHLIAFTLSLVMIVGSSVFLLSLTFCCLHSIDCTCYVPCDDHQSTYFLYLPINTYLLFSWWHPVHWPLSLFACLLHLCICILTLTFLYFPHRSWVVTSVVTSVMRTSGLLHRCPAYYQLWLEIFSFIVLPWSVLSLSWTSGLLHRCPAYYHLWLEIFSFIVLPWIVLSLSWTSGLLHRCPAYYRGWTYFYS